MRHWEALPEMGDGLWKQVDGKCFIAKSVLWNLDKAQLGMFFNKVVDFPLSRFDRRAGALDDYADQLSGQAEGDVEFSKTWPVGAKGRG